MEYLLRVVWRLLNVRDWVFHIAKAALQVESTTEQRAVERMFENAIQACSALAQHIATRAFDFEG